MALLFYWTCKWRSCVPQPSDFGKQYFWAKQMWNIWRFRRDCMISWWFVWELHSYWQICLEWECIGLKNCQCGALKSHTCVHYDEEYRKAKWLEGHSDAEDDGEEVKQFNDEGTSSRSGSFGFWFFSRSQKSCRGLSGFWFFSGSWNSCRGLITRLWFSTC